MKKMCLTVFFVFMYLMGFSQVSSKITSGKFSTIYIPINKNIVFNTNTIKGISFKNDIETVSDGYDKWYNGYSFEMHENNYILVTRVNGALQYIGAKRYESYVSYKVKYYIEKKDNQYVISFIPEEKQIKKDANFLNRSLKLLPFSEDDLINYLQVPIVKAKKMKFEFNSDYSEKSIQANFDRLAEKKDDLYELKIKKSKYFLKITFKVRIYPYKNGSKIKVYVKETVLPKSYREDGVKILVNAPLKDISKEIEAIIND